MDEKNYLLGSTYRVDLFVEHDVRQNLRGGWRHDLVDGVAERTLEAAFLGVRVDPHQEYHEPLELFFGHSEVLALVAQPRVEP